MSNIMRPSAAILFRNSIIRHCLRHQRVISTSRKNRETAAVAEHVAKEETNTETVADRKNWVSYGFSYAEKEDDRNAMHSTMFFSITLCMVIGGFVWAYIPDFKMRDWAQREGYLELRRREQLGLPLIDPNFVDPAKMQLPSDEELENTEIII